jgi:outer membrane protein assembly factor BamC
MMMTTRAFTLRLVLGVIPIALLLGACSTTFEGNKVDYKSQGKAGPGLEVPPDLSQLTSDRRAIVPSGGVVNASAMQGAMSVVVPSSRSAQPSAVALSTVGDVRVQREGSQRWLVVGRAPDKLWDEVKSFWLDNGFTLVVDQANLGIMETEWNENRAKLPQDGVRRLLGKVLDSLYSTNERDKFRTRLERSADGGTEIFISHKGMIEDFTTATREQLKWKMRPIDPELEVEFLKRLMVRLGADPAAAQTSLVALPPNAPALAAHGALLVQIQGQPTLLVNDTLDQAWRRVGLSLDRTSFTVEDRDRSKGIYFVRYTPDNGEKNASGFWARLFGGKVQAASQQYQVTLNAHDHQTKVTVANAQGIAIQTADAQRILQVLADDLK